MVKILIRELLKFFSSNLYNFEPKYGPNYDPKFGLIFVSNWCNFDSNFDRKFSPNWSNFLCNLVQNIVQNLGLKIGSNIIGRIRNIILKYSYTSYQIYWIIQTYLKYDSTIVQHDYFDYDKLPFPNIIVCSDSTHSKSKGF